MKFVRRNFFKNIFIFPCPIELQTKRITEEFTGPSRIVEIQALLEKEIQLLNGIENRRSEIQREMQAARQDRMLEKIGETVKWIGYRSMEAFRTISGLKALNIYLSS